MYSLAQHHRPRERLTIPFGKIKANKPKQLTVVIQPMHLIYPVSDLCDDVLLELDFSRADSASIWRFDLETNMATEIGSLSCDLPEPNDYFMAMSADTKGQLWLLSRQGWLFKVLPSNLSIAEGNRI